MKKILFAAALTLVAIPAFAQGGGSGGGAPYGSGGTQAGGPLAGEQRRMGAPGGQPATFAAPAPQKRMRPARRGKAMKRARRSRM